MATRYTFTVVLETWIYNERSSGRAKANNIAATVLAQYIAKLWMPQVGKTFMRSSNTTENATFTLDPGISVTITALEETPPPAPSGLAAAQVSTTEIDLTWTDESTTELGFKIERALAAVGPWVQIDIADPNAEAYSDTGLDPETRYYYRIRAFDVDGDSDYAAAANAYTMIPAPTLLAAAAAGANQIDLTWTDNSSTETGFSLERSPDGLAGWVEVATPAADAEAISDTGLDPETEYFYRIKAVGAAGSSDYSNVDSATTTA